MSPTAHFPRVRGTKGGLRRAPGIIPDRPLHRPRAVEGHTHAAQRIAQILGRRAAVVGEQAVHAVDGVDAAVIQDL